MWVFAGGAGPSCVGAVTVGLNLKLRTILALIGQNPFDRICALLTVGRGQTMRSVKTIVTFAAIASSIFAVSWVGLALLGF
jgi:hypothetical protein